MGGFLEILNNNAGLIGLLGLTIAIGAVVLPRIWARQEREEQRLLENVRDPTIWEDLIHDYRQPRGDSYRHALEYTLSVAEYLYGDRAIGIRTYGVCLTLAMIYAFLSVAIAWVAFNTHAPAGLPLFLDTPGTDWRGIGQRGGQLAMFAIGLGSAATIIRRGPNITKFFVDRYDLLIGRLTTRPGFLAKAGRWVVELIVVAIVPAAANVVAFAGAGAVAFAGASAFAFAVAIAGTLAGANAFAVIVAGAGAIAFAFAFAFAFAEGKTQIFTGVLLLYALLPVGNALADFLSVGATRFLLRKLDQKHVSLRRVLGHLVADLFAAVACLTILLVLLAGIIEAAHMMFPQLFDFDWRSIRDALEQGDMELALPVVLMAVTTLIPTMLHLVLGLQAIWGHRSRARAELVDMLQGASPEMVTNYQFRKEAQRVVDSVIMARYRSLLLAVLVVFPAFAGFVWAYFWALQVLLNIA
ncbi:hypothetical protein SAMN04488012_104226 [Palleronia salina]|uniref:Uncharacterized protein n=1 Tax=Palleronia salina TaxID=313368 RepID=A0A1M6G6X9_9RHOB|nr:hypothetical protein [Palleronia salina]SHJ05716.1 hypothetical protein SAMN04488012_104226 [Palleronia salina]